MGENDKDHEEKQEERQIIGRIDFDLDEDGFPIGILRKSSNERNISYSLLILVAGLHIFIQRYSSSSDNNSKKYLASHGSYYNQVLYKNLLFHYLHAVYGGTILEYCHPLFG